VSAPFMNFFMLLLPGRDSTAPLRPI
jgi:hypothetical protein